MRLMSPLPHPAHDDAGGGWRRPCGEHRLVRGAARGGPGQSQRARRAAACGGDPLGSVAAIVAALIIMATGWVQAESDPLDPGAR